MEKQTLQNNQTEVQSDTMTLGDFMANAKPSANNDTLTYEEFMGQTVSPITPTVTPIPIEHKDGFISHFGKVLYSGMLKGATDWNNMVGFGVFAPEMIKSGYAEVAKLKQETYTQNKPVQFANDLIESFGNMGVTLPFDIMTGGATKTVLAGKVLPEVEAILSKIPNFALGSGWRGLIEGVKSEPNKPIEGIVKGIAGAGENIAVNSLYASAGVGFKGIGKMAAIGGANAVYEAAKVGRPPSKDELITGTAQGAAYGIIFSMLPALKEATQIEPEKTALGKYEGQLNNRIKNGDFLKAQETVDTLMADESIRPEIKDAISKINNMPEEVLNEELNKSIGNVLTPETQPAGEQLPAEPPKGKVAEVPSEGETKVRGLAKGVEEKAIENKLTQSFSDLPEYQTVNMKEQASKAQELLTKDPEMARRVAMGEELPPEGVLPESVFVAIENKAIKEGDVATLKDLATSSGLTSEATTMGQRIRTLAERDPESPVTAINEVNKARKESAQKRLKTKDTNKSHKEEVAKIKDEIKKVSPTKETWADFIRSIQC